MTGAGWQLLATEVLLGGASVRPGQSPTPAPAPGETGTGAEFGKAAPIGLVVVLLLLVATILLIRSMNRHVKAMPTSFDTAGPAEPTDQAGPGGVPGPR